MNIVKLKRLYPIGLLVLFALITVCIAIDAQNMNKKVEKTDKILMKGFCPECIYGSCQNWRVRECWERHIIGMSRANIHSVFNNTPLCKMDYPHDLNFSAEFEHWICEGSFYFLRPDKEFFIYYDNNMAVRFFISIIKSKKSYLNAVIL